MQVFGTHRFSAGNPLALTVLVSQVLRDRLTTTADIEAFVARLRAGEAELEPGKDAALGRTRSLAASLSYGFSHAFTEPERSQLAALHLFRDTVDTDIPRLMGDPAVAGDDAVPQLTELAPAAAYALLDRAAAIGMLSAFGSSGFYAIHPALPWYFTTLYTTTYGQPSDPAAQRAARAYAHAVAALGNHWQDQFAVDAPGIVPVLRLEEANLQHALALARRAQDWGDVIGCLRGLYVLYGQTGRTGEWARLVADITPDFVDPATDGPLPGRDDHWSTITQYRVLLASAARDWPTATRLQHALTDCERDQAATALAVPDDQLTLDQRNQVRSLAVAIESLDHNLLRQGDPDCLRHYEEALGLYQRIGASSEESKLAISIGHAYKDVPALRNLGQAEHWYRHSLNHRLKHDWSGQAVSLLSLADVAYRRFLEARSARASGPMLVGHLNAALTGNQQALDLIPADDAERLFTAHNQLGLCFWQAGDIRSALRHYQQAIRHAETAEHIYGAGMSRYNTALLLKDSGRTVDALHYASAALEDFERTGPGAR